MYKRCTIIPERSSCISFSSHLIEILPSDSLYLSYEQYLLICPFVIAFSKTDLDEIDYVGVYGSEKSNYLGFHDLSRVKIGRPGN